jgi:putative transposase
MIRTIVLKLVPRKQQKAAFEHLFSICWSFYNHFLQERLDLYAKEKKSLSCFEQQKRIKDARTALDPESFVHTHLLQDVCKRIQLAYEAFFRRVRENKEGKRKKAPGFPKLKKPGKYRSCTFKEHGNGYKVILKDDLISKVKITNVGSIRVHNRVRLPQGAKFLTGTLLRKADGYYFTLTYSCSSSLVKLIRKQQPLFPYSDISHKAVMRDSVGIDIGIKDFLSSSDRDKISCAALQREHDELKKLNRVRRNKRRQAEKHLRDPKGSRRYRNLEKKIARQHLKIARVRADFQHKVACWLLHNYHIIFIEKLNIGKILENSFSRDFSRRIHSAAWSQFFSILKYKADGYGNEVREVEPHWTSQICAYCLEPAPKALQQKEHYCPGCSYEDDRDIVSAKLIRILGYNPEALSVPRARLALEAKASRAKVAEAPTSTRSA